MARAGAACVDRRTGAIREDPVHAPRFLRWAYDTRPGWALTALLLSRPWVSRLYGWVGRQGWSRRQIRRFVARMNVDVTECARSLDDFRSFDDFIVRRIEPSRRPIDGDPLACIAPVDGRVLAFPALEVGQALTIKRAQCTLRSLLRDAPLAERYGGGAVVLSRLHLADYHHFHFPAAGIPRAAAAIPGRLFATSPYSARRVVPFLTENARTVTVLDSDAFGEMVMVEIGAFTIGSIRQCYEPGRRVERGAHKGFFELGGSVVVLLFQPDAIRLDQDLCTNTRADRETYVRMGEAIGRAPRRDRR